MSKIIATVIFLGYVPLAPGTLGSLAGLILAFFLELYFGFIGLLIFTLILFFLGWYFTSNYIRGPCESSDPSEIVIDEVVGQLVTILPTSYLVYTLNAEKFFNNSFLWIWAFILFRFFDIAKPWPINWVDKKTSSLSVMLDDILAGIYASIATLIIFWVIYS